VEVVKAVKTKMTYMNVINNGHLIRWKEEK